MSDFRHFLLKNITTYDCFMLVTYQFHNKILIWGQSGDIGFWPFSMALKAPAQKFLCYDLLDFFGSHSRELMLGLSLRIRV